jgi:hypothetical protein
VKIWEKIFVLGDGGFGREVLNIFIDLNRKKEVFGFLEENGKEKGKFLNTNQYDITKLNELIKMKSDKYVQLLPL